MTNNPSPNSPAKKERIPLFSWIFLALALLSFLIVIIAKHNMTFAAFFNRRVSSIVRAILATLTNPLPFSLAELLIFLIPAILVGLIWFAVRRKTASWKSVLIYTVTLLSVVSLIFTIFVFGYGVGYYVPTLDTQLGLDAVPVSAEELKQTALWLIEELDKYDETVEYRPDGSSVMPYSFSEMNEKLMVSYKAISTKYTFIQRLNSRIKPVMASVAMSYAHFTGVYTFFTGEANLNVDFPDYTLPYTAAHEFSHQRGIARENEANFMAFLVCVESDDTYLQYCGYLNLYEYVASALYSADPDAYIEIFPSVPARVRGEMKAYSAFYEKYRDSEAGKVGNSINNAFLQANGNKEGTKSYGMVVDLAVAYYRTVVSEHS